MNVYQAFSAVQKEVAEHGIAKGKTSGSGNYSYKYRGIDDVYNVIGPLLAKHGVLIIPKVLNSNMLAGKTGNGKNSYHHTVSVEYNVYGPEGDAIVPAPVSHGECIDTSDKGLNKALSAAYKYWVLTAFCVPLEGQEEADATTPETVDVQPVTPEQMQEILGLCMQSNTEVDGFIAYMGYPTLKEMPSNEFHRAKQALQKKLEVMAREYAQGEQP